MSSGAIIRGRLTTDGFATSGPQRAPNQAPLAGANVTVVGTGRSAVTDGDGYFLIADLGSGTWSLYATATVNGQTMAFYMEDIHTTVGQTTDLGIRQLTSTATLTGSVASGGTPLADAAVRITGLTALTDTAGAFSIPSVPFGSWTATAEKIGYISAEQAVVVDGTAETAFFTLVPAGTPSGQIRVSSSPTGADIHVDGILSGMKTNNTVSGVPVGSHTVEVRLSGYDVSPAFQTADVTDGGLVVLPAFTLTPAVPRGNLLVTSEPSGARIYLNGNDSGQVTPALFSGLPAVVQQVRVEMNGFTPTPAQLSLTVPAGETAQAAFTLNRVQVSGNSTGNGNLVIRLTSWPAAYTGSGFMMIFIDNAYVTIYEDKELSVTMNNLAPGEYHIFPFYEKYTTYINMMQPLDYYALITANQTTEVVFSPETRNWEDLYGELEVRATFNPSIGSWYDVDCYVDDLFYYQVLNVTSWNKLLLNPGTKEITVSHNGYSVDSISFSSTWNDHVVIDNTQKKLFINIQPQPGVLQGIVTFNLISPGQKGNLEVTSDYPGANITLDGFEFTKKEYLTPTTFTDIAAGTHTVSVRKPYIDTIQQQQEVYVSPNNTSQVHFNMSLPPNVGIARVHATGNTWWGYLLVDGKPAQDGLEGQFSDVTPLVLALPVGEHHLSVHDCSSHYTPFSINAQITEYCDIDYFFQTSNLPVARIEIESNVLDAELFIDGMNTYAFLYSDSSWNIFPVTVGAHTVVLQKAGYSSSPSIYYLTLAQNERKKCTFSLQSIPTGSLSVTSTPAGATIMINGNDSGHSTPYTFTTLDNGDYTVEVILPGYITSQASQLVTVSDTSPAMVDFTLSNESALEGTLELQLVSLQVQANWAGTLYPTAGIDLELQGKSVTTGVDGQAVFTDVEPGTSVLTASQINFQTYSQDVTLFAGANSVTIPMTHAFPILIGGKVENTRSPVADTIPGSRVTLINPDGSLTQYTDTLTSDLLDTYLISGIPLGDLRFQIESGSDWYQDATIAVTVTSSPTDANFSLVSEALSPPGDFNGRIISMTTVDAFTARFYWTPSTAPTLAGYQLYVSTTSATSGFAPDGAMVSGSFTDYSQPLQSNRDYWFRIVAINMDMYPSTTELASVHWSHAVALKIDDVVVEDVPFRLVSGTMGAPYSMGSSATDETADNDEFPLRTVHLGHSFYISQFEMSQGTWETVMGSNPAADLNQSSDYPVVNVSWDDVQEFISRMNLNLAAASTGYVRLPTEAEWEWACRQGSFSNQVYPWGDTLADGDAWCWNSTNSGNEAHPVNSLTAAANGLYHMNGNVWEWCSDWYGQSPYPDLNVELYDPQGPASGTLKSIRGGSWHYVESSCRTADRSARDPNKGYFNVGFRLVFIPGPRKY